ncbi:MAG: hypothetical protein IT171_01530 [Acidobacteria bacterium]|nr:hypothetical protein [Acidobacteriota bacterium]
MAPKEHNKLVGIFLLVHGSMQALIMAFIALIYLFMGGAMFAAAGREGAVVGLFFIVFVLVVVGVGVLFTLPQIIGGLKMMRENPSARTWGIIGSIIACLSFPLGTAAGVYGLWFLFGDVGKWFYLQGGNQIAFQSPPPPPPNSWQ